MSCTDRRTGVARDSWLVWAVPDTLVPPLDTARPRLVFVTRLYEARGRAYLRTRTLFSIEWQEQNTVDLE
jgi:hypothetical protein